MWTRDIVLTEEQHERLRQANPIYNQQLRGQEGRRATARAARLAAQERGRAQARQGDPLHMQGCMLFWAEGSRRATVSCSPTPISRCIACSCASFAARVRDEQIALTVNCHLNNGLTLERDRGMVVGATWSAGLLPARRDGQPALERVPLAAATCTLRHGVARRRLHLLVQSIYGAIQEYAGFERPEWLD